ncbi:hypothetical protein CFO_g4312 [Ceratocystis platani]|uniref:Uncharacterized protein n=1 Tax=Ceratocystis fimbriata f. sp. platani TaxID=88771 RepID=A0A0F8DBB6_CERFI|nr:hypothetical protein CFO_g4312 [Ceratocystis platani]
MKFPCLSSATRALLLSGLAQAGVFEQHGYEVENIGHTHAVFSPQYLKSFVFLDLISFYPETKIAAIYIAKNDQEQIHENKLSLSEIFVSLCQIHDFGSDDMRGLVFDIYEVLEVNRVIDRIRSSRDLGPKEEVEVIPGSSEWDIILDTEYYTRMLQVTNKQGIKILLMSQDRPDWGDSTYSVDRIYFSFLASTDKASVTGMEGVHAETLAFETRPEVDGEDEETVLKAKFAEEEEKEIRSLATISNYASGRRLAASDMAETLAS